MPGSGDKQESSFTREYGAANPITKSRQEPQSEQKSAMKRMRPPMMSSCYR
jgi:hypothetical protein